LFTPKIAFKGQESVKKALKTRFFVDVLQRKTFPKFKTLEKLNGKTSPVEIASYVAMRMRFKIYSLNTEKLNLSIYS
jgi:ribosomal protein L32E